ncbi:MAG: barstar family protein [Lachnospiraceae bacterium]|nr:barstar family protein [Lachnospiraceae bacterium]
MKTIIIDGSCMESMSQIHDLFSETLDFPEWYGRNLDALHDCLTELNEPLTIELKHAEQLKEQLHHRAERLIRMLQHASQENELLTLTLED